MCMDFQFFLVLHDNSSPNSSYRTKLLQKTFPIIKSCTGEIIRIYVLIHAINKLIPYGTSLSLKEKKTQSGTVFRDFCLWRIRHYGTLKWHLQLFNQNILFEYLYFEFLAALFVKCLSLRCMHDIHPAIQRCGSKELKVQKMFDVYKTNVLVYYIVLQSIL